jgi:hypothetical protein
LGTSTSHPFPILRWAALVWMLVWLPAYILVWGLPNLLHLCDIAVIFACAGLWLGDSLLLSSQSVSLLAPGVLWCADAGWRLFTGRNLVGGTEYMWDVHYPLWVRLLSLFHIGLPIVLLYALRKTGYDRRALAAQSAIAAGLLIISRFWPPQTNLNYAYQDPLFHRAWGIAPLHLGITLAVLIAVLYLPAHVLLGHLFPGPYQPK